MRPGGKGRLPRGAHAGKDGSRIAFLLFQNERDRLFTMNVNGSAQVSLTGDDGINDGFGSWSPAGDRLAFINYVQAGAVQVYVINADGTGAVNITNSADFEGLGPQAWGP